MIRGICSLFPHLVPSCDLFHWSRWLLLLPTRHTMSTSFPPQSDHMSRWREAQKATPDPDPGILYLCLSSRFPLVLHVLSFPVIYLAIIFSFASNFSCHHHLNHQQRISGKSGASMCWQEHIKSKMQSHICCASIAGLFCCSLSLSHQFLGEDFLYGFCVRSHIKQSAAGNFHLHHGSWCLEMKLHKI